MDLFECLGRMRWSDVVRSRTSVGGKKYKGWAVCFSPFVYQLILPIIHQQSSLRNRRPTTARTPSSHTLTNLVHTSILTFSHNASHSNLRFRLRRFHCRKCHSNHGSTHRPSAFIDRFGVLPCCAERVGFPSSSWRQHLCERWTPVCLGCSNRFRKYKPLRLEDQG
jgi:hypothetical protein